MGGGELFEDAEAEAAGPPFVEGEFERPPEADPAGDDEGFGHQMGDEAARPAQLIDGDGEDEADREEETADLPGAQAFLGEQAKLVMFVGGEGSDVIGERGIEAGFGIGGEGGGGDVEFDVAGLAFGEAALFQFAQDSFEAGEAEVAAGEGIDFGGMEEQCRVGEVQFQAVGFGGGDEGDGRHDHGGILPPGAGGAKRCLRRGRVLGYAANMDVGGLALLRLTRP